MFLKFLFICIGFTALSACGSYEGARFTSGADSNAAVQQADIESVIDSIVQKSMAANFAPGLSMVVIKDGDILLVKGYGTANVDTLVQVNADTLFGAGSLSKSVTAVAIMRLVEQGLVDLDLPVTQYIPYFKANSPLTNTITVRHLLTMSSGLPSSTNAWQNPLDDNALKGFVENLASKELLFNPGTNYEYSNDSYVVLGHLIEAVTGMSYENYMLRNILHPLGMKASTFNPKDLPDNADFQGHVRGVLTPHLTRPFTFIRKYQPTGMLITNARDLGRYIQFQLGTGKAADGEQILSTANMKAMHHPAVAAESTLGDDTNYAFGWETKVRDGYEVVEHGGEVETYVSYILLLPEQNIGIGMLVNMVDLAKIQLIYNVAYALTGREVKPYYASSTSVPDQPELFVAENSSHLQFVGNYKSRHGILEIKAAKTGLKAIRGANGAYREEAILLPLSHNMFFSKSEAVRADSLTYHFKVSPAGVQVFVNEKLYATQIPSAELQ